MGDLSCRASLYRMALYGRHPRYPGHAGASHASLRAAARLWNRQSDSQHLQRSARYRIRVAVSGAQAAGVEGLDRLEMGDLGAQPPRQELSAHGHRPKAAQAGTVRMGGVRKRGRTGDGAGARRGERMNWKKLTLLWPSRRRREELNMQEELKSLAQIADLRELGNLTLAAESARKTWDWTWLESVVADVRYA